ncbi:MAG: hypothetical protein QM704_00895 [Anaeromyxobacteraceae bacterium]
MHAGFVGAQFAAQRGRLEEAAAVMATALRPQLTDLPAGAAEELARGIFGDAAAHARALEIVNAYLAGKPRVVNGNVPFVLNLLGEPPERALELAGRGLTSNDATFFVGLWLPQGRRLRTAPAFSAFARRLGLVEIWDREGPPDLCERKAPGEYVCR